jgi:hypothetical protein
VPDIGATPEEGTDTLINVEYLIFADGTLLLRSAALRLWREVQFARRPAEQKKGGTARNPAVVRVWLPDRDGAHMRNAAYPDFHAGFWPPVCGPTRRAAQWVRVRCNRGLARHPVAVADAVLAAGRPLHREAA